MKAARLHKIGDFRVDTVPKPTPKGKEILIKVAACGICGSDIPRIFTLGTSKKKYPLTLGHEFGGRIVEVGEEVDPTNIGRRGAIFPCIPCMKCGPCSTGNYAMCHDYDYLGSRSDGGFAEYCLVPSMWHFIEMQNEEITDETLGVVEPCTVAQHAIRKSLLRAYDSIVIFGAGPIGIMAFRWAKIFGASKILLVDISKEKIDFAKKHGCNCLNATSETFIQEALEFNDNNNYDIAMEGTGTTEALNNCINLCKTFGNLTLYGNPTKDTIIKLKQHSTILRKELNINGVWNSTFNASENEWKFTMEMLDAKKIKVDDLITNAVELEEIPALCSKIYQKEISICKAIYKGGN